MTDRPDWGRRAINAIAERFCSDFEAVSDEAHDLAAVAFDALGVRSRGCWDAGEMLFSIDATRDNPEKAFEEQR